MITEMDLRQAIAECQGERNPNAQTCIKLAAYYTILHEVTAQPDFMRGTSADPAPAGVYIDSDSEFAQLANGKSPEDVWAVVDELMRTLSVVNPRLYQAVIRNLKDRG